MTDSGEAALRELFEIYGDDGARQLIADYLADTPAQLDAMDAALAAGDGARLRGAAHQLKSTSTLLGLRALAELCQDIERLAGEPARAAAPVSAARQGFRQAAARLRSHLG